MHTHTSYRVEGIQLAQRRFGSLDWRLKRDLLDGYPLLCWNREDLLVRFLCDFHSVLRVDVGYQFPYLWHHTDDNSYSTRYVLVRVLCSRVNFFLRSNEDCNKYTRWLPEYAKAVWF